ncbi:hypothetical protein OG775_20230 [Streptomyces platensis]|uniref:hypothetical protein n=1 Tax=Streptomyces platensis TaxID=58346 RepID=UPI00225A4B6A|nr:hypothetical protein [Streptomyces platensis]MCX4637441.1 hypothetical protein [Streptomyces platensis]
MEPLTMTRSARRKFMTLTCAPMLAVGLAVGVSPTAAAASADTCSPRTVDGPEIGRIVVAPAAGADASSSPVRRTLVGDACRVTARNRAEAAKRDPVDLSAQPITVNGMGPLRIGMSRQAAERAIGARIPDGPGGPECRDLAVEGGPQNLSLRFSNDDDRLVAISVLSSTPASLATASGVHVGSTREDVLDTYDSEVTSRQDEGASEELVFAPRLAKFHGRIISFLMNDDGTVASFIAGERYFADPLPCGND